MKFRRFLWLAAFCFFAAASAHTEEPGAKAWSFDAGQMVQSSPLVGPDGTVYIGVDNAKLLALRPDGSLKWDYAAKGNIASAPALGEDGTIYFGSIDRSLYALSPAGKLVWQFTAASGIASSPAIGIDGTIYFGTVFNKLYAVSKDGQFKWDFTAGGNIISSPAIGTDGTIYVGSFNDMMYAINPNGTRKWDFTTGDKINSSPAIGADGTIYVGSFDGKLYAVLPNGTKKWEYTTGSSIRSSPAIGVDGTIYVGSDDRKLHAVNPDGSQKWTYATGYWIRSSPAIGEDGVIYVGSYDNSFYAINADGSKKWDFPTGNYVSSSPAIGANGLVYFGSWDKNVYALKASAGLAESPWPKFRGNLAHTARSIVTAPQMIARTPGSKTASVPGRPGTPEQPSLPMSVLLVGTNGVGRVSPALGGQLLEVGKTYTLHAEPGRDYQFTGWTGSQVTNAATIKFVMKPNLQLQANFSPLNDKSRPTIEIVSPLNNSRIYNPVFAVRGNASDNIGVHHIEYSVNDSPFRFADGTNSWLVRLSSIPGTNTVRVKSVDLAGNESVVLTHSYYYVVMSSLTVRADGEGAVTPTLGNHMLEVGKSYTLTAEPGKDHYFAGWSGDIITNTPKLTFLMQSNLVLKASFTPFPFQPVKGVYRGLYYETNAVAPESAGMFTVTVNGTGAFNGSLQTGASTLPLNGQLDADGYARLTLPRGKNPVTVDLYLDFKLYSEQIRGLVTEGATVSSLVGDRSVFDAKIRKAPQAGRYTLIIPGDTNSLASPGGDGFAAITVDASGAAKITGELADGTQFSLESGISKEGVLPFYEPLYGGKGVIMGWIQFNQTASSDLFGQLTWIKPPMPQDKYYPNGFATSVSAFGSQYVPPASARAPDETLELSALLRGGNLNEIAIDRSNMKLTLSTSSGLLNGYFVNPQTGKSTAFKGALLQKQNWRSGYFLGPSESGCVFLK